MALQYYFFDAQKQGDVYDRVYTARDFTSYLDKIVGSGVFPNPSDNLQVFSGTGMQVIVHAGQGWIDGHKLINTADMELSIDAADVTLNRIDRIVFRVNNLTREMEIVVKKGAIASTPTAPEIVRTADMIEYGLATVYVGRNVTSITQANITDTRFDTSVCGVVQGLVQQADTRTLFNQWLKAFEEAMDANQDVFDAWFDNVKDTLVSKSLIKTFKNRIIATKNMASASVNISQYVPELDILEVYVNGFRLDSSEYTMEVASGTDQAIVNFTLPLTEGSAVEFVIYKTIDTEGVESVVETVSQLSNDVSGIQTSFKSPTLLYDGTVAPTGTGLQVTQAVLNMALYDIFIIRCQMGASTRTEDKIFFKGLGATQTQYVSAYANATYNALATVGIQMLGDGEQTAGMVSIKCDYIAGWTIGNIAIKQVYGIKL